MENQFLPLPVATDEVSYMGMVRDNSKLLKSIKDKPYFSKGDFVLYKANCLDILEQIPTNSIDMIFADPPYNLSNGGFSVHAGKRVSVNKGKWDRSRGIKEDFEFQLKWIEACKRVLKPAGSIWISGTYHSIYQCGYALQTLGYHILNDVAWYKPNASPNLSCRFLTASHETLIWARKDKTAKHIFNYNAMRAWESDKLHNKDKQMRSVWSINTPRPAEKKHGKHPTQKPLELLNRVVACSTKKNSIILDPFTGSSTTGLVALSQGRKFIGIDLEKEYLDLSKKRFNDL